MNALKNSSDRESSFQSIFKKLQDVEVEEILSVLEAEVEKYLRKVLPPKTDYSLTISFTKKPDYVNIVIDLTVKGNILYSEDIDRIASETVKYAREKLIELLEKRLIT